MITAAFLNENTLGHTSYLPRFAAELRERPDLGINPVVIDALPLQGWRRVWGDRTIRWLRRYGADMHAWRWRVAVSAQAAAGLAALRRRQSVEAIVVNTQSVGLGLGLLPSQIPTLVGLDATFRQLADSPWCGPNPAARRLQPVTMFGMFRRERALFSRAAALLPWSAIAEASLLGEYGVAAPAIMRLPPSLRPPDLGDRRRPPGRKPRLLFIGGDFKRKGGELVLECHRRLADRCDLVIVTRSEVASAPGVLVRRGVEAGADEWFEVWREADLFVFPSRLETFGIVLLEALAFGAPVLSSNAGAAAEVLGEGAFGVLQPELTADAWTAAITRVLDQPEAARARAAAGRKSFLERYDLGRQTERLAERIRQVIRARR